MSCCPQQTSVPLPYYRDYSRYAIWPSPNSVSKNNNTANGMYRYSQANSYFALISKSPIVLPNQSCQSVSLPFFPGHLYVAYKAEDTFEVIFIFNLLLTK